jgi:hypothetical protein
MYKQLPIDQSEKDSTVEKWTRDVNRQFIREEIPRTNKYKVTHLTSLVIGEMQIKMSCHFTPKTLSHFKRLTRSTVGRAIKR